ncbi:MAG: sigma-E processing peptidase SpoIIGA [Lachnospiraceae bacterium]|nr:sigma-E processing peptidase SpoIIGA [Lachnospiraceae bacterium]
MLITVYLDLVFLINFVANMIVLVITCRLMRQRMKLVRIILGAGFGAVILLPLVIRPGMLVGVKGIIIFVGTGIGTVYIALGKEGGLMKKWCLSTTIMVLMGGIISSVKYKLPVTYMDIYTLLCLLFFSGIVVFILVNHILEKKKVMNNVYRVILCHDGKNISEKMYLDTGNLLWDPLFDKPAIILSEEVVERLLSKEEKMFVKRYIHEKVFGSSEALLLHKQKDICFHEVAYESVGKTSGKLLCFLMDEVVIVNDGKWLTKQPVAVVDDALFCKKEYKGLLFLNDV